MSGGFGFGGCFGVASQSRLLRTVGCVVGSLLRGSLMA